MYILPASFLDILRDMVIFGGYSLFSERITIAKGGQSYDLG